MHPNALSRQGWSRTILLMIAILLPLCPRQAAAGTKAPDAPTKLALRVHDPLHVGDAIRNGDTQALDEVLSKSIKPKPVAAIYRWFALAGRARIRGDLAASSRNAKKCYTSATKYAKRNHNFVIFSMSCGELLAGNALLQGKLSVWATTLQRILAENREAADELKAKSGLDDAGILDIPGIDLKAYAKLPDVTIERPVHRTTVLPRVKSSKQTVVSARELEELPYVRISINGVDTIALLDTGTSFSLLPRDQLTALQVHASGLNYFALDTSERGTQHTRSELAIANRLQIGDVMLRHAPFGIVDGGPVILGLDILHRLAPFLRFDDDDVRLYASPPKGVCTNNLIIQSEPMGFMTVALQQQRRTASGAETIRLFLDTGMNAETFATGLAGVTPPGGWSVEQWTNGVGRWDARVGHEHLTLLINGYPRRLTTVVRPTLDLPDAYGLGALILRDFDLGLDFAHHTGCLLPKHRPLFSPALPHPNPTTRPKLDHGPPDHEP